MGLVVVQLSATLFFLVDIWLLQAISHIWWPRPHCGREGEEEEEGE